MKFFINAFLPVIFVVLFSGCSEFIEKSVEGKKVVLLAPGDSIETNKYTVDFWWEPVEDVLKYRLQIVSPSFDSTVVLVADTLVSDKRFSINLDPGKYTWRLRGENGSSVTLYTQRTMTIHESSIVNQQVRLLSPLNNSLTNDNQVTFKWDGLFGSINYRVQIDTANFANEASLVLNSTTQDTEYLFTLSNNKKYHWRVRAENDTIVSKWSSVNHVTLDNRPPNKVNLVSPVNNSTSASPVNFAWESVIGAISYELSIFKDNGVTLYSKSFPLTTTSNNYVFNGGIFNETIVWKVRAKDEAGNYGEYSEARKVIIQ